jgi:hypothetical protein
METRKVVESLNFSFSPCDLRLSQVKSSKVKTVGGQARNLFAHENGCPSSEEVRWGREARLQKGGWRQQTGHRLLNYNDTAPI